MKKLNKIFKNLKNNKKKNLATRGFEPPRKNE